MSCRWKRASVWHTDWQRARAECMWYVVREEIEDRLGLTKVRKGKPNPSCVVGFHFELRNGKPTQLREMIDQELVETDQEILVRIMPKCVTVPPRMRSHKLDASLTEEERILAMQGPRYHVDRIGDEPPPHYVCRNCSCKGHYYKQCLWQKVESQPSVAPVKKTVPLYQ